MNYPDRKSVALFLGLALLAVLPSVLFSLHSKEESPMNTNNLQKISPDSEQKYWDDLLSRHAEKVEHVDTPYFYSSSRSIAAKNAIKNADIKENGALFLRQSTDNGIEEFQFYAWNDHDDIHHIYGDLDDSQFLSDKDENEIRKTISILEKMAVGGNYCYGPSGYHILDATNTFLTIRKGGRMTRYATYDAEGYSGGNLETIDEFSKFVLKAMKEGALIHIPESE